MQCRLERRGRCELASSSRRMAGLRISGLGGSGISPLPSYILRKLPAFEWAVGIIVPADLKKPSSRWTISAHSGFDKSRLSLSREDTGLTGSRLPKHRIWLLSLALRFGGSTCSRRPVTPAAPSVSLIGLGTGSAARGPSSWIMHNGGRILIPA
jgi:hypothetical protein